MTGLYLDWNATAPLSEAARLAIAAHLDATVDAGLNPSSQHAHGRAARAALETARRQVASTAGAQPTELVFTSGASEAMTMALLGGPGGGWDQVFVSAIEHDCALAAAQRLARERGVQLTELPATPDGVIDLDIARERLSGAAGGRALVVAMAANNETGALQPVAELTEIAHDAGAAIMVDAAQALNKTPFDFGALDADLAVLSSHKIGGPPGVGALLIRDGLDIAPLIAGGGQEMRRRPGTENLLGAVGFGAAAAAAKPSDWAELAEMRDEMERRLKNTVKDLVFCSDAVHRLPNTCCFAALGWRADSQLMRLDLAGFSVSAGSACSSGKMAPSHVLRAMGFGEDVAACAIRVSIGPGVTAGDVAAFADAWLELHASRRG